jgi:ribonuclease P/MRP protein subunit POP5
MVRFKNRHLLVEFLDISALSAFPAPSVGAPDILDDDDQDAAEEDEDEDEDMLNDPEDELAPLSSTPFMLAQHATPLFGDEGTGVIYKAVRGSVQGVFGDEGWGRVGSSFKGE